MMKKIFLSLGLLAVLSPTHHGVDAVQLKPQENDYEKYFQHILHASRALGPPEMDYANTDAMERMLMEGIVVPGVTVVGTILASIIIPFTTVVFLIRSYVAFWFVRHTYYGFAEMVATPDIVPAKHQFVGVLKFIEYGVISFIMICYWVLGSLGVWLTPAKESDSGVWLTPAKESDSGVVAGAVGGFINRLVWNVAYFGVAVGAAYFIYLKLPKDNKQKKR